MTRVRRAGFPHSDIVESCVCTRLLHAFRSVPRPSSAEDAKASPMCPYLLCSAVLAERRRSRVPPPHTSLFMCVFIARLDFLLHSASSFFFAMRLLTCLELSPSLTMNPVHHHPPLQLQFSTCLPLSNKTARALRYGLLRVFVFRRSCRCAFRFYRFRPTSTSLKRLSLACSQQLACLSCVSYQTA